MSFHSHSSTPAVIAATPATSPKYSMSGIANEINKSKSQNGILSTLFGRSKTGFADRVSNLVSNQRKQRDYWTGQENQIFGNRSSTMRPGSSSGMNSITSSVLGVGTKGSPSGVSNSNRVTPGASTRR